MNVAVIGASAKPDRYSYKAMKLLAKKGHIPFPIHPSIHDIDGITVYKTLLDVAESLGVDAVVTACPLCQMNLDMRQSQINTDNGANYNIPVFYFTQLMAKAFDLTYRVQRQGNRSC